MGNRKRLPPHQQLFNGLQTLGMIRDDRVIKGRGEPKGRDIIGLNHFTDFCRMKVSLCRVEDTAAAIKQPAPKFQRRGVETERRELQKDLVLRE